MRKEKKIKQQEQSRHTILIIGAVLVVFLAAIIITNVASAFKKIDTRNCVKDMVLVEEGMLQMKKEFRFDVPQNISYENLLNMMAHYYYFGQAVFENSTTGTLILKSLDKLKNLPEIPRKGHYVLDIYKCPSKGKHTLIPNKAHPGLFDVTCSVHGALYLPNKEGKYAFTGDIDALVPRATDLGREADIYLSSDESSKETVTIIPFAPKTEQKPAPPKK